MLSAAFLTVLSTHVVSQTREAILDMPPGEYSVKNFSDEQLLTLEKKSDDFSGLAKIASVDSLHPNGVLSADKWPEGAWGRGYQTWPNVQFYPLNTYGYYWSCHPLIRDVACFTKGHLYLYLDDTTRTTSERLTKAGIDYLLDEQIKTGKQKGLYTWWLKRQGLENLTMEPPVNKTQPYETCYALVTLCDFYRSGINHRRPDVYEAIDLSTQALLAINWQRDTLVANSNSQALGIWSLAAAYKVNPSKQLYNRIEKLTKYILKSQHVDTSSENGLWLTGGTENIDGYAIYHDTKIYYHLMILRGLIESFSIIPDSEKRYKTHVADAIKRGLNHIIQYRIDRANTGNFKLKYAAGTIDNKSTPDWFSHDLVDMDKVIEPLVKIASYSENSMYFSPAEHENLVKLAIQIGQGLNPEEAWYICSIGYYIHYMHTPREK